jgi:hypothetical protein
MLWINLREEEFKPMFERVHGVCNGDRFHRKTRSTSSVRNGYAPKLRRFSEAKLI